jgi:hypothetical protein
MAKRAFIFGAGFSIEAGFPRQGELLRLVTEEMQIGLTDLGTDPDAETKNFLHWRAKIVEFLNKVFVNRDQPLESVFTLLDEAIGYRTTFSGYSQLQLMQLRDHWIRAILFCLHKTSEAHLSRAASPYERLAMWWALRRILDDPTSDEVVILSLNWDSLVEDSVFKVLKELGGLGKVDIDYCVYTTPLNKRSWHMPSPKQGAAGRFNLKLLKMHGSSTWLRCPESGLVYTGLGTGLTATQLYLRRRKCPFLQAKAGRGATGGGLYLEPYIITPTFTKVFDLPHIQTTWHNAYVELREADEITFVGYSLPDADYSFRTLLLRSIRPDAQIRVILFGDSDNPPLASSSDQFRRSLAPFRYQTLFGPSRISFDYNGARQWIQNLDARADPALRSTLEAELGKYKSIRARGPILARP